MASTPLAGKVEKDLPPLPSDADVPLNHFMDCNKPGSLPVCSNQEYSTVSTTMLEEENVYTEAGTVTKLASSKKEKVKSNVDKRPICLVATLVGVLVLMVVFSGLFVALFLQISTLRSQIVSSQQINASIHRFEDTDSNQILEIQRLSMSIADIGRVLPGLFSLSPATSCAALPPSSPSGYYWVVASNGSAVRVYCDMTRSCGNVTGGWMRVAELDMTNSRHQCPSGLRQRTDSNKRTCVRESDSGGCSSVNISTATVGYSRVCGRIIGYQESSVDAFLRLSPHTIDMPYVDGVSLTHGNPKQHLWTFAAALDEVGSSPASTCPCTNDNSSSRASQPPAFVGNDYYCDTGSSGSWQYGVFYGADPLWDGAGCGPLNACCSFNNPPWFSKQLPQPTTDYIEMRVCRDEVAANEDIAVEIIEIYVQ